jgi:hypothetical protein
MRSVRAEQERNHHPQRVLRLPSRRPDGIGLPQLPHLLAALAMPLLLALTAPQARHWLAEAGATLCVAGGFIAAPFLTLTAWIGLALPPQVGLHQASSALFVIAIIWIAAALIGAHLHHSHQAPRARWSDAEGE